MTNPIDKAQLRALAEAAKGWMTDATAWPHPTCEGVAVFGNVNEDGEKFDIGDVDTGLYFQEADALPLAQYIAAANPAVMRALLDELATQAAQIEACRAEAARWRYVAHTLGDYCVVDAIENTIGVLKGAALDAVVDAAIQARAAMKEKTP